MALNQILKKTFTHGHNMGPNIRLYYQHGRTRRFIDVTGGKMPWYFYVRASDFKANYNVFMNMKDDRDIIGWQKWGKANYRISVQNKNIPDWRIREYGDTDKKVEILATLDALGIPYFEADLSSLDRFLVDNDVKIEDDYYIGYFDIETDDRLATFEPGAQRILSMAVVDNYGKVWYHTSKSEEKLLVQIVKTLKRFAVIVGYNSRKFDLPYIKKRCEIYGIEYDDRDQIHIDFFERMLDLYRYDKEGPPGYRLDDISMHFLKEQKVQFSNDKGFYWNWRHNHAEFKRYNIKDTKLLKRLDDKLEIIKTMTIQSKLCGIFLNRFYNTRLTDMYLLRLAKREGIALPTKREHIKVLMPGGRVHEPKPGIYDNVEPWDFSQMYSTIMQSFQISPETIRLLSYEESLSWDYSNWIKSPVTLVMKLFFKILRQWCERTGHVVAPGPDWGQFTILDISDDAYRAMLDHAIEEIGKSFTLKSLEILRYFIKREAKRHIDWMDVRFTYRNQPIFRKSPESLVRKMLRTFVTKRNHAKAMMKKYEEGSPDWKLWNAYNLAYKLMGNVVFGYMSSNLTRCYSHAIACSITFGGQCVNNLVKIGLKSEFGIDTIYGDTDSTFLQLLEEHLKNLDRFHKTLSAWFKKFISNVLSTHFNIDDHCMTIEPETLFDRLLIIAKKNYIAWMKSKPKGKQFKSMGIDYVKRSTIGYTKKVQERLVKRLLKKPSFNTAERLKRWALKERQRFDELEIADDTLEDFIIHTRVEKNPDDYASEPVHARIVRRMLADGEQFFIGGVLQWVIIKSDSKKMEGEQIDRFAANPDLRLDRDRYWSKYIYSKLQRIFEALHPDIVWQSLDPAEQASRQKRIATFQKGLLDPKRQFRSFKRMIDMKEETMHPQDKKFVIRWAREEAEIDVDGLFEEMGIESRYED